ncbi:MAG: Gfo/Idh/MocA family oxidoreductase [Verrucomicrobiota bacterium]|nr:Gfo/Idh/MocA family oxidoreductase [Verrucomicrobiota bacterium]
MKRKKYVLVGSGGRSRMFYQALTKDYRETSELSAICDVNQVRMDFTNNAIKEMGGIPAKTYKAEDFDKMIATEKPDIVIVTTIDRLHHSYIVRSMELGCDVISEKPMTIDEVKCQEILDTIKKTGKELRVTFNYRYSPVATKVRELIMNGEIGNVTSVHFEWLLNTSHGADYYRRWHRDKRNSGGLMVHKSTHHFDLVNFWLGTTPVTVFGMGDLKFYGKANAEARGVMDFYYRSTNDPKAKNCKFALDLNENENLKGLYLNAQKEDGYLRDQSVFGDGINIEDTMGVMVRYKNNAIMTYSLNSYLPREGFNVSINGDQGRIDVEVRENVYVNAAGKSEDEGAVEFKKITLQKLFEKEQDIEIAEGVGGHGGGDVVMLNDIFGEPSDDPFKQAASHVDGAMSIMTGIAANKSFATGLPVNVDSLIKL